MSDSTWRATYRRTCPASALCSWRGPTVVDEGDDDGEEALDYHLQLDHPDALVASMWETWEVVHATRRQRASMVLKAAVPLVVMLGLLWLLDLARQAGPVR